MTKRSSRHTQNSVASLRAEIRDTGQKPVHVLRTTARRPLADETPQGRAVGTRRPQLCAATQPALRGQERALTKKTEKEKRAFFDEGRDALRAVLWAVGPAPRARVSKRKIRGKENAWKSTREDNLAT